MFTYQISGVWIYLSVTMIRSPINSSKAHVIRSGIIISGNDIEILAIGSCIYQLPPAKIYLFESPESLKPDRNRNRARKRKHNHSVLVTFLCVYVRSLDSPDPDCPRITAMQGSRICFQSTWAVAIFRRSLFVSLRRTVCRNRITPSFLISFYSSFSSSFSPNISTLGFRFVRRSEPVVACLLYAPGTGNSLNCYPYNKRGFCGQFLLCPTDRASYRKWHRSDVGRRTIVSEMILFR